MDTGAGRFTRRGSAVRSRHRPSNPGFEPSSGAALPGGPRRHGWRLHHRPFHVLPGRSHPGWSRRGLRGGSRRRSASLWPIIASQSPLHSSGRRATRSRIRCRPSVTSTTRRPRLARTALPSKCVEMTAWRSAGRSGATAYRPGLRRTLARPRSPVLTRSRRPRPSSSTAARIGTRRGRAPGQECTTMRTATVTWAPVGAVSDREPQPATAASIAVRTLAATAARARRCIVMPHGRRPAGCGSPRFVSADTLAEEEPRKRCNRSLRG